MGLFDFLKSKKDGVGRVAASETSINTPYEYVDGSSVDPSERPFYKPDSYYTYCSYPGSSMGKKVVTFEERKKTSFPSKRGLYVAEILLLSYCSKGDYPKPKAGYPGLWWFEYGVRDVGHALESLEERGFVRWAPKASYLQSMKVSELSGILADAGLSSSGKKAALIERIVGELDVESLSLPGYTPKYELTDLGSEELEENGYVPYMHSNKNCTIEDVRKEFNVWSINRLLEGKNPANWRDVVGAIEQERFGMSVANAAVETLADQSEALTAKDIKAYLKEKASFIEEKVELPGDGFQESQKGIELRKLGDDREAIVWLHIAIGKKFDAPATYQEAAIIFRKYKMYKEELQVINKGLRVVKKGGRGWETLNNRKEKVKQLIEKAK